MAETGISRLIDDVNTKVEIKHDHVSLIRVEIEQACVRTPIPLVTDYLKGLSGSCKSQQVSAKWAMLLSTWNLIFFSLLDAMLTILNPDPGSVYPVQIPIQGSHFITGTILPGSGFETLPWWKTYQAAKTYSSINIFTYRSKIFTWSWQLSLHTGRCRLTGWFPCPQL